VIVVEVKFFPHRAFIADALPLPCNCFILSS